MPAKQMRKSPWIFKNKGRARGWSGLDFFPPLPAGQGREARELTGWPPLPLIRGMKKLGLFAFVLASAFAVPLHAGQEEMVDTMEAIDDAYKALKTAKGPEAVKLAREAQANTLKALAVTPDMAGKMPEGVAKDLALADFRRLLGLVYLKFVELEKAHLEGKPEAAEALRVALKELRKEGHRKHIEEEEN